MPSYRVSTATVSLKLFETIGQDGDTPDLICHSGLAASEGPQGAADVSAIDISPPLHGASNPARMHANAVGSAELQEDEIRKIQLVVDRHANEHAAFQHLSPRQVLRIAAEMYCIVPHTGPFEEADGRYARTRFSCAGFVLEAYRFARIVLVDPETFPLVDLPTIKAAYPAHMQLVERGIVNREGLGLTGSGPWKVLLCGYLLHALNRSGDAIRHGSFAPLLEHRYFPSP